MARIETYGEDNNITDADIVLGSDGDNFKKTKNYTIAGLKNYFLGFISDNIAQDVLDLIEQDILEQSQDNIVVYKRINIEPTSTELLLNDVRDKINSSVPAITITKDQVPIFEVVKGANVYFVTFNGIGKGTYGFSFNQVTTAQLKTLTRTITKTSQLTNDGDGNFPFLTEEDADLFAGDIDGGSASSVYLVEQNIDGGNA